MTNKALDDKHSKILRTLLLEPDNKKCFDCSMKGPVYVCIDLGTFVCTTCSGIHREFNRRVKSISMATFKPEEIKALQSGGNALAKRKWLARWNPDDFPEPDSSDQVRIRQFMKLKYEDKRWMAREDGGGGGYGETREARNPPPPNPKPSSQYPTPEPLTNILKDIPPIYIDERNGNHTHAATNNHTQKPLPQPSQIHTQPPPAPSKPSTANSLMDWDDPPAKATTSGSHDLNDLFGPSADQHAVQYQQEQQKQQYLHQQAQIMAQFNQGPPPNSVPTGWFSQTTAQGYPNTNAFVQPGQPNPYGGFGAQQWGPQQPQQPQPQQPQAGQWGAPPVYQQQGSMFTQPQGPQQPPPGYPPQSGYGGPPQPGFGGQGGFGTQPNPAPIFGSPTGGFISQQAQPPQQGGFGPQPGLGSNQFGGVSPQGPPQDPFGGTLNPTQFGGPSAQKPAAQQQPQQPQFGAAPTPAQPEPPKTVDIFASLSPLNAQPKTQQPTPPNQARPSQPPMVSLNNHSGINGVNNANNNPNPFGDPFGLGSPSLQPQNPAPNNNVNANPFGQAPPSAFSPYQQNQPNQPNPFGTNPPPQPQPVGVPQSQDPFNPFF